MCVAGVLIDSLGGYSGIVGKLLLGVLCGCLGVLVCIEERGFLRFLVHR